MNALRNPCWIAVLLLLSSCAAAPAPTPSPAPARASAPEPDKVSRVSLLCGESARMVRFETMGVPADERPRAVALDSRNAYVLFPSRLLRIPQGEERFQAEMTVGRGDDLWVAMDLDPVDGSVWIATDRFVLRRISPDWKNEKIQLQKVSGEGGFEDIRVTRDALYASPICAQDAVWRLDRTGKVLGSAFPVPERKVGDEPLDASQLGCSKVRLERDAEGNVVAWDHENGKVFRVDGQGAWTEVAPGFFKAISIHDSTAKGLGVGTASEQWYVSGSVRDLFYWKGRPVFLGPMATRSDTKLAMGSGPFGVGSDTVLILPDAGGSRDIVHNCEGAYLFDVATTAERYAAITEDALIVGQMAGAPDLP
jgi:hypothetical protein